MFLIIAAGVTLLRRQTTAVNIFVGRNSLVPGRFGPVFPGFPEERTRSSDPEGIRGTVVRCRGFPVGAHVGSVVVPWDPPQSSKRISLDRLKEPPHPNPLPVGARATGLTSAVPFPLGEGDHPPLRPAGEKVPEGRMRGVPGPVDLGTLGTKRVATRPAAATVQFHH